MLPSTRMQSNLSLQRGRAASIAPIAIVVLARR